MLTVDVIAVRERRCAAAVMPHSQSHHARIRAYTRRVAYILMQEHAVVRTAINQWHRSVLYNEGSMPNIGDYHYGIHCAAK